MKIVRKSNAQATTSSSLEYDHGPPIPVPGRSSYQHYAKEPESYRFKSADFSHMSRHELHELISCQTRSGELSLEDSATLAWLSVNLPTDNDPPSEYNDHEIVNFLDGAQLGKNAALSNDNSIAVKQFEVALDLMHSIQGQTIGVDTIA